MNVKDFMGDNQTQMILVQGIGQMRLDQAKKRIHQMLTELNERVGELVENPTAGDQLRWRGIQVLLDRGVLQAYVDAVAEATKRQH